MTSNELADFFAVRLSELRTQKGVSARDMSLSIGQNPSYINKIESKRSLPSMTGFFDILEYLNIKPEEFFNPNIKNPYLEKDLLPLINSLSSSQMEGLKMLLTITPDDIGSHEDR